MMKRNIRYLSIPLHIWTHPDLSVFERVVLIEIDSYSDSNGCSAGAQALSSSIGLPAKTIKETLKSLQEKGAIEVRIDADGNKKLYPYLYKERYLADPNHVVIGDKPSDVEAIDYAYIQEKWNEICNMLSPLERLTPRRKTRIRSVLKQSALSVEDFIKCFKIIACTPFLNGQSDKFKATFDWIVANSQNATKVYEGFYSRSYQEKRDYEAIIRGEDVSKKQNEEEDYYR